MSTTSPPAGPPRAARPDLDQAIALLQAAWRRVSETTELLLQERGLGRLHHRLLFVVGRSPGIEVGRTLEELGITKQAAHGPLRDLVDHDLVIAMRDPQDARRKRLYLTVDGAALERTLARLQHAALADAFERAGPDAERGWTLVMQALGEEPALPRDRRQGA